MILDTTLPYAMMFESEKQPAPIVGIYGTGWLYGAVRIDHSLVVLLDDEPDDMTTRAAVRWARAAGTEKPMTGYLLTLN